MAPRTLSRGARRDTGQRRGRAPRDQVRPGCCVPLRIASRDRRGRRDLRADGCRPVARPGGADRVGGVVEHGADVAIGSRYVPGGITLNWPRRRRRVSRWGNRYAAGVLGLAINDATAGYRAYRSTALEQMRFDNVTAEGYGFQIEMTYRIVRLGGKVVEFPITFRDRMEGESKFTGSIVREALLLVVKLWIADFGGTTATAGARRLTNWDHAREVVAGGWSLDQTGRRPRAGREPTPRPVVDWTPPGGVIDPGETISEGLVREVREETGLVVHELTRCALPGGRAGARTRLGAHRGGLGGRRLGRDVHRRSRRHRRTVPGGAVPRGSHDPGGEPRHGSGCRSATGSERRAPSTRSAMRPPPISASGCSAAIAATPASSGCGDRHQRRA